MRFALIGARERGGRLALPNLEPVVWEDAGSFSPSLGVSHHLHFPQQRCRTILRHFSRAKLSWEDRGCGSLLEMPWQMPGVQAGARVGVRADQFQIHPTSNYISTLSFVPLLGPIPSPSRIRHVVYPPSGPNHPSRGLIWLCQPAGL